MRFYLKSIDEEIDIPILETENMTLAETCHMFISRIKSIDCLSLDHEDLLDEIYLFYTQRSKKRSRGVNQIVFKRQDWAKKCLFACSYRQGDNKYFRREVRYSPIRKRNIGYYYPLEIKNEKL